MSPCLSLLPHQLPPFHLPNTSPALFSALLVLKSTVPRLPPSPRHSLLDVPTQSLKVPRRSHLECQGWAAGVPGVKEWVSQALEAKGEFSNDELNSHLPLFTRDTGLSSTSPTPAAPPTHTHTPCWCCSSFSAFKRPLALGGCFIMQPGIIGPAGQSTP